MIQQDVETTAMERVRIDRWLWAARFYKTRSQAATAIDGGKVHVNGNRVKRSKMIEVGNTVRVSKGPYEFELEVLALAEKRGSATIAQTLYRESEDSQAARRAIAEQRALERAAAPAPIFKPQKGRPTKKDRRDMARFKKRRSGDD